MYISDVLFALNNLLLASFREPSLLWQLAPILLLWIILIFYFATHKHETLGWNTSLANGISLFWVMASVLQRIFSDDGIYFTWLKFIVFGLITLYSLFVVYISFQHTMSAKWTYLFASHHLIYYFSLISILYAYDMIYLTLPMIVAILLLFGLIILSVYLLKQLLPSLKEDLSNEGPEPLESASFEESSFELPNESSQGGIEERMGKENFSESNIKF